MLYLALVLTIVALFTWSVYQKRKRNAGITGWVKTQDLDGRSSRVYRDEKAGISCKPDVVMRNKVIEYKSAPSNGRPRWVDMLQVALQMKATGKRKAELRYGNNEKFSFQQDDPEMQAATRKALSIADRMRNHLRQGIAPKGTPSAARCAKCAFHNQCPEAIR
jgi:CRISPR/Cas system-associated exonuclease Cas4 (RecB family)